MDKLFLLTYTEKGSDGLTHSRHAWFETEEALRTFVQREKDRDNGLETDLAIEILDYREIDI